MGKSGKSRPSRPYPKAGKTGLSALEAELYERNWAYLSVEAQAKLRQTVIFAAGVGVASNIVTLACRTGFRRFILADGDRVELSNLNRQDFTLRQLGKNKAKVTARRLRRIRPDVEVSVLPYRLDESNYQEPLSRADIVVNSIDFDERVLFLLNDAAQDAGKSVLQPVNFGWGGAVLTFLPGSQRLSQFLGVGDCHLGPVNVKRLFVERIISHLPGSLPPYLHPLFAQFQAQGDTWASDPQLGVAATLSAALAVRIAVALSLGEPVRVVPEITYCDARVLTGPATP